jgi:drug/metabolite transporter (DMT)-like permease
MKKGYIYIVLATLLFSSMEITLKFISGDFNPIQLTFSRFLAGGIFLLPFALWLLKKKQIQLEIKSFIKLALLSLIGIVISMTLYQLAVLYTKASVVAVLFSSNPVFVMFFAYLLLREPIHKHNIISLLLEITGILVIINPLHTKLSLPGILFTLLATLMFALYGVLGKKECGKYGGLVVTCFSFLLGSIEMIILTLCTHIPVFATYLSAHNMNQFIK